MPDRRGSALNLCLDASAVVPALLSSTDTGAYIRDLVAQPGVQLIEPAHMRLEVLNQIRRFELSGELDRTGAELAAQVLQRLGMAEVPAELLHPRVWELRHNLTPYDAAYVAVAEQASARLITADGRLVRAPGPRCEIELLSED